MKNYFRECKTAEELKKEYKKLAMKFHPDVNAAEDATEVMKEINSQYAERWEMLKNVHVNKDGEIYNKETTEGANEFIELLEVLIRMKGVMVELIGSWLWLTGETKNYKDQLKKMGFRWSPKKTAWYFHNGAFFYHKNKYSLDDIRNIYGNKQFEHEDMQQIAQ